MASRILLGCAIAVFLLGNALRIWRFLRMPPHLRWDLYPIPKGPQERQRYGGSYLENSEWWMKPIDRGHFGEVTFMLKEVLLLRGVWENFRALWPWSLLLHWGLYFYVCATVANLCSLSVIARNTFVVASVAGVIGVAGVLAIRIFHKRIRAFTTRGTIFNLVLLGLLFATISPSVSRSAASAHVWVLAFFLVYFPFTHMTHAYMKYFTWHGVRWDDEPASSDTSLRRNLNRTTTWSATHIASDSPRTWSEVVAPETNSGGQHV